MKDKIRSQDVHLVKMLKEELEEFITQPIPNEKFEDAVSSLIYQIRKTSRKSEHLVQIDQHSVWDKKHATFLYDDKELVLTKKEREFLSLLFKNINQGYSYHTISLKLWGDGYVIKQDRIKTLVKQLRKKLPQNIIKNIFGFGYKIEIKK
jgi:DNA-binding response OmpR family regulator